MTRSIRIDGEGDGRWIMDQVGGSFDPRYDHSFCALRDGERVGGFTTCNYLGRSIGVHMAGTDKRWCTADLLWMLFDYIFNMLGVRKALTTVASTHYRTLAMDMRAGWRVEAVIAEAFPDADMVILSMQREHCRWLNVKPKGYKRTSE